MTRIAVDAMGGDYAPREIVRGAVDAARGLDSIDEIVLVGDEAAIRAEMSSYGVEGDVPKLRIVHASEVIEMGEHPVHAVRSKPDSSINRGISLVKSKEVDAFVSAGSTGAMVASSLLNLRRIWGVKRPAIGTVLPSLGKPYLLLDMGATVDCTPRELEQFAVMGSVYSRAILGQESPSVGLLSIGTEEAKGDSLTKDAFELLKANPNINFAGNVEGHDLFKGEMDVCVADGFVGNVVLKTIESESRAITAMLKKAFTKNLKRKLGALMLKGAFRELKQVMDPEMYGGAPLLGVNGIVIITHGSSSKKAIFHAIRVAGECVAADIIGSIGALMEQPKAALHDGPLAALSALGRAAKDMGKRIVAGVHAQKTAPAAPAPETPPPEEGEAPEEQPV